MFVSPLRVRMIFPEASQEISWEETQLPQEDLVIRKRGNKIKNLLETMKGGSVVYIFV